MSDSHVSDAPAGAIADAERALDALHDEWSARYGAVVSDLAIETAEGASASLTGTVLLPSQRDAALGAVTAALDGDVEDRVTALVEADEHCGWLTPRDAVLSVLTTPDGTLSTQVLATDPPVRCLARRGSALAVEAADATVGWVREADSTLVQSGDAPSSVAAWRASFSGVLRAAPHAAWLEAFAAWLGTDYLWGGTTREGVDCSGLTQRLYRQVLGIGLPRHSSDQARCGRRTDLDALLVGDLLFLTQREARVSHVAVVLDGGAGVVGHACRVDGHVVSDLLPDLLARYRFRGARRFEADSWPPPVRARA